MQIKLKIKTYQDRSSSKYSEGSGMMFKPTSRKPSTLIRKDHSIIKFNFIYTGPNDTNKPFKVYIVR